MHDDEFLSQLESCRLPKDQFRHRNHLRLCWLYLTKYDVDTVINRTRTTILCYATSIGSAQIYHETLTRIWIYLVLDAQESSGLIHDFDDFIAKNSYLLDITLPLQYYSKSTLESELARKEWVLPDKKILGTIKSS